MVTECVPVANGTVKGERKNQIGINGEEESEKEKKWWKRKDYLYIQQRIERQRRKRAKEESGTQKEMWQMAEINASFFLFSLFSFLFLHYD